MRTARERRRRRRGAVVNLADRCPGTRALTMHEQYDILYAVNHRARTRGCYMRRERFPRILRAKGKKKKEKRTPEMRVKRRCREDPARNILYCIYGGVAEIRNSHAPLFEGPCIIYIIIIIAHRRRGIVVSGKFLRSYLLAVCIARPLHTYIMCCSNV